MNRFAKNATQIKQQTGLYDKHVFDADQKTNPPDQLTNKPI